MTSKTIQDKIDNIKNSASNYWLGYRKALQEWKAREEQIEKVIFDVIERIANETDESKWTKNEKSCIHIALNTLEIELKKELEMAK